MLYYYGMVDANAADVIISHILLNAPFCPPAVARNAKAEQTGDGWASQDKRGRSEGVDNIIVLDTHYASIIKSCSMTDSPIVPPEFPEDGILWHEWNDETLGMIEERDRPVLLFVSNPDPSVAPFLKGVLRAMPLNEKLRDLLHHYYIALMVRADSMPEYLEDLDAGRRYNIAVLSPAGLTPMVTIDPRGGRPEEIVETILKVLQKLQDVY